MSTAADNIVVIQGDSTEIYRFNSPQYPTFDNNWSATLKISTVLGGDSLLTRILPKTTSPDLDKYFILQLTPSETEALALGQYSLVIEIKNDTLSFKRELVQGKLVIKPQGISV